MLYPLFSYFKFILKSTNRHGIHSPFVYKLVDDCFRKPTDKQLVNQWKSIRKDLLDNTTEIEVTNFGADSRIFSSNKKKVNAIVKHFGIRKKRAELLIRLVDYFQTKNILEIGTSVGLASSAMSIGNSNSNIIALEECPETSKIATNNFNKYKLKNISLCVGEFSKTLTDKLKNNHFDLIFIDGNNSKEATINYFSLISSYINNDTVLIFNNIHRSNDMEEVWQEIIKNKNVTVSIDTFQWGIVFFRKGQEKEHFIIRI